MKVRAPVTIAGSGTAIEGEYRRLVDAIARCTRHDVAFDPAPYDPRAVEAARGLWRARMRAEYESIPAFAALAVQMVEANATLDVQGVVLRMAADEVRHAEICGDVLRALGADPRCEIELPLEPLPTFPACSPEERVLRNVLFGNCLVEMVNTANLVDAHDTTSDAYLAEALRRLLADEALHGAFGYHYLSASAPWLDANPQVRASLDRFLRRAFAHFERIRSGVGAPPRTLGADERALGLPDPARLPLVFYETVENAIVPALEGFGLAAREAWKHRSLDAPI